MNPSTSQLRTDVAALATPAGRMVGSHGHAEARRFLCARMAELHLECYSGARSYALPYEHGGHVIVAFFDAEEPPYFLSQAMGSVRFVLDQMDARGVGLAIIQDLTGHEIDVPLLPTSMASALLPRIKNLLFMTGAESHPALPEVVQGCLPTNGVSLIATLNEYVGDLSDHHIFRTTGLPYLFFSCGRWEHYHTRSDTPEKLAYGKMAHIATFLAKVAQRCATQDLPKATGHDTTQFEVTLLKEAVGMFLPLVLPLVGLKKLESRADLDAVAARLMGLGL